jgi:hypothetical protein
MDRLAPWQLAIAGMPAGAVLFGAGMVIAALLMRGGRE